MSVVLESPEQTTARIVAQAATATATAKAVMEAAQAAAAVIARDNVITSSAIAVLQTEMAGLKIQQTSFEAEMNRKMDSLGPKFDKIFGKLDDMAQGRPTWAVALILGSLFSLCVGLIVYTATHL